MTTLAFDNVTLWLTSPVPIDEMLFNADHTLFRGMSTFLTLSYITNSLDLLVWVSFGWINEESFFSYLALIWFWAFFTILNFTKWFATAICPCNIPLITSSTLCWLITLSTVQKIRTIGRTLSGCRKLIIFFTHLTNIREFTLFTKWVMSTFWDTGGLWLVKVILWPALNTGILIVTFTIAYTLLQWRGSSRWDWFYRGCFLRNLWSLRHYLSLVISFFWNNLFSLCGRSLLYSLLIYCQTFKTLYTYFTFD